jgi:hypothetical protein
MKFRVLKEEDGQAIDPDGRVYFLRGWRVVDCVVVNGRYYDNVTNVSIEYNNDTGPYIFGPVRAWDAEMAHNIAEAYRP